MNKLMFGVVIGSTAVALSGCATKGLTEEAQQNVPTTIWYENANLLVDANDPDMKADTFIGVPALDAVVDTVKDIVIQVPMWIETKVEENHFNSCYLESAKALNGGADGADLVVKGEAFKSVLLFDTFADEVAHAKAAHAAPTREERFELNQKNGEVYEAAVAKTIDYANNQIFAFENCADDAARTAFFAESTRQEWEARTVEIVSKIKECVAKAENEDAAKAAIAQLCKDMGVNSVDWQSVAKLLAEDLNKLQQAAQDFANALQSDTDLATKIAAAAFGGEIVPGTSGKETLAIITRVGKQLTVSVRLISWLIKSLAV